MVHHETLILTRSWLSTLVGFLRTEHASLRFHVVFKVIIPWCFDTVEFIPNTNDYNIGPMCPNDTLWRHRSQSALDRGKPLTHWGRVTHICVSYLTITGSDNGLSPGRRQAIIWTNAGTLLTRPLVTNFSEILIEIHTFSFKKMHLKMSSGKWQPFCIDLNVLTEPMLWQPSRTYFTGTAYPFVK